MVTAKNLQLLDTQGNNISPAVNIETIYYEQTVGNVVHRNHIFKHFPVYVKYNGKPSVNYTGTILTEDSFYMNTIVPYEDYKWPDIAEVAETNIYKDPSTFDSSLGGDVVLQEYSTSTPNDIYVAGIRQTPLNSGTDFMRLDISTYNLSLILKPVAYKEWVNVRLDYYNTKIDNNNIYDSSLRKITDLKDLTTYAPIGGLTEKVPFDSLNGLKYTELFDKLLLGPVNPKISDFTIDLNITPTIFITDQMLESYHNAVIKNLVSYQFDKINTTFNSSIYVTMNKADLPVLSKPNANIILPYIIKEFYFLASDSTNKGCTITYNSSNGKYYMNSSTYEYSIKLPWNLYDLRQHLTTKLLSNIFVYNTNDNINNKVCDSLGNPVENITNIRDLIQSTNTRFIINCNNKEIYKSKLPIPATNDSSQTQIKDSTVTMSKLILKYPIKFGSKLDSLSIAYVTTGDFNKIDAFWDPSKTFYVCVPRILTGQLVNPIPTLYRIFQASRWQMTTNWNVSRITGKNSTINKNTKQSEYLEGYIIYIILPIGTGETRHILFSIDLSMGNLLKNKQRMALKSVGIEDDLN